MTIHIERVYEFGNATKGTHFLVDRIWPRGIKKEKLQLTAWLREAAPSNSAVEVDLVSNEQYG